MDWIGGDDGWWSENRREVIFIIPGLFDVVWYDDDDVDEDSIVKSDWWWFGCMVAKKSNCDEALPIACNENGAAAGLMKQIFFGVFWWKNNLTVLSEKIAKHSGAFS